MLNGLFTLVDKVSSSLGIAFVGILLSIGGYVAHRAGGQSPEAIRTITLIWAVFPACAYSAAIVLVSLFRPITPDTGAEAGTEGAADAEIDGSNDIEVPGTPGELVARGA